jgi:NADPH-dependent glutamate synthase beta subunit-like oxidoreductase/Pyruvate/2-oxoacid:ferredoxin oxidoreductase delta subunit
MGGMFQKMTVVSRASKNKRRLPPCRAACPADVNVQGYIALLQQGRFKEAVELIRKSMPFPAICGRVCFSPCQDACSRKNIDQPVGIRYLKRLAADIEREQGRIKPDPVPKTHGEKVAIVGAGPAGLSAAYELAKLGYPVTVFERMPEPGGMMWYGIPDFRLRKYVVANEIAYIQDLGVEIKAGVEFGKDVQLDTLRNEGYKAIFIAVGAQLSRKLGIPGEDLEGVFPAVEFLRNVALGKIVDVGEKVAVIGGGNSAIDAARTALRLGAREVTILYRRSRNEMPALPEEVEAAEEEEITFYFLVSPKQIIGKGGKVKAIECLRMELGEPDASGRRRPVPIQGTEHTYEVDTVIPAIGQLPETSCLPPILLDERARAISVDPLTLETSIPSVFSGGDIVTGPASVIEAIGAGKRAAVSIDRYLNGQDLRTGREEEIEETTWVKDWEKITKKPERYVSPHVDVGRRRVSFEGADELLAKTKEVAMFEARRCLECGPCSECLEGEGLCEADKAVVDETLCTGCNVCAIVCPFGAIKKNEMGVAQVDDDLCKGCGICCASCPERAITMQRLTDVQIITDVVTALGREFA